MKYTFTAPPAPTIFGNEGDYSVEYRNPIEAVSNPSEILSIENALLIAKQAQRIEPDIRKLRLGQNLFDLIDALRALEGRPSLEMAQSMLSWSGHNIRGDDESIRVVKAALHDAGTVPELKQRIKEMQEYPSGAQAGAVQRPASGDRDK